MTSGMQPQRLGHFVDLRKQDSPMSTYGPVDVTDDGSQRLITGSNLTWGAGILEMSNSDTANDKDIACFLFAGVTVPQGATINSATLTILPWFNSSNGNQEANVYCEDTDDADDSTTTSAIYTSRYPNRTTASWHASFTTQSLTSRR